MCYYGSCLQCRITGTEKEHRDRKVTLFAKKIYLLIQILVFVKLFFLIILCWMCKLNYVILSPTAFFVFLFLSVTCLNTERRTFQIHGMQQIKPHSNYLRNEKSVWLMVLTATCDEERRKASSAVTVANLSLAQFVSAFGQILFKIMFLWYQIYLLMKRTFTMRLWFSRRTLPLPNCLVPPTPGGARTHLETLDTIPSWSLHLTGCLCYKKYCRCQKSSAMRRCFTGKYKNNGPGFLSRSKTGFMVAGVHFLDVFHLVQHMFGLKCCSRQSPSHGFTFFSASFTQIVINFIQVIHPGRDHSGQRKEEKLPFFFTRNYARIRSFLLLTQASYNI